MQCTGSVCHLPVHIRGIHVTSIEAEEALVSLLFYTVDGLKPLNVEL